MAIDSGNLFVGIPRTLPGEQIDALLSAPNIRIERIVSRGHSSPPGFWYDQDRPEWVIVIAGSAAVLFEGAATTSTFRRMHAIAWNGPTRTSRRSGSPCITAEREAHTITKSPGTRPGLFISNQRRTYRTGCCGSMFAGCCW